MYDGVGPVYPRGSLQKRKQYLQVGEFLCLRSKRLHVQQAGLLSFQSVQFQRSYTAPRAASLYCTDTSVCSVVQGSLHHTSLHDEGIIPVFDIQWTSISHTTVLDLGLLNSKIKEDIFTVNTTMLAWSKGTVVAWQDLIWVGKLT